MEKENELFELKNKPAVCAHLEFLQSIISRMGGNSANIKAVIVVVYTIFITILIDIKELKVYWWIGLIIALVGMIMDTYYLAFERMYRKRYNKFVKNLNEGKVDEKEIYNMNPKSTDLKYEVLANMLEAISSFSITGFYILFVGITILLKFI